MAKRSKRIFQVAKDLNISHTEILNFLKGEGIDVASHMSPVDEDSMALIETEFSKDKENVDRYRKEQVRREIHNTRIIEQQKISKRLDLLSLDEQRKIEEEEKEKAAEEEKRKKEEKALKQQKDKKKAKETQKKEEKPKKQRLRKIDISEIESQIGQTSRSRKKVVDKKEKKVQKSVKDAVKQTLSKIDTKTKKKQYKKDKLVVEELDDEIKKVTLPRPGHADLAGVQKYGFDDIRNVLERSSARETTMRVALGSVCRKFIEDLGIQVGSRVIQIHDVKDDSEIPDGIAPNELSQTADASPVRCLDKEMEVEMIKTIDEAKAAGDSVGGIFEVIATGLPYGLGSPMQWDRKLQARISAMMMSVNAFKGIEIGGGAEGAEKLGSEVHDEIGWDGGKYTRHSNNAGGIEGGMSNAQPIVLRMAMKPIATLIKPLRSVDIETKEAKEAHKERTDSCAVPAASIISESMLCFVLADALLEKFGGDSMDQLKAHMKVTAKY